MISEEVLFLYRKRFAFKDFYNKMDDLMNANLLISKRVESPIKSHRKELIECVKGDIRVDLPVAIGNSNAKHRLAILGLEPRDSHTKFNIEREGKFVFGSPFGIEWWNPRNKYYKSFATLLNREDCFLYFTDVVKEYEVKESKEKADKHARKAFWDKASNEENITFLKEEMSHINPTHIIALGRDTYAFLKEVFGDKVVGVKHPNARQNRETKLNAWDEISNDLNRLLG